MNNMYKSNCWECTSSPVFLSLCDHSICQDDLEKLTSNSQSSIQTIKCPTCNQSQQINVNTYKKQFQKFQQILDKEVEKKIQIKLEEKLKDQKKGYMFVCKDHLDRPIEFYCKIDKIYHCVACIKNHIAHYDSVEEFGQQKIVKQANQLIQELDKMNQLIKERLNDLQIISDQQTVKDSSFISKNFEQTQQILNQYFCNNDEKWVMEIDINEQMEKMQTLKQELIDSREELKPQVQQLLEQKSNLLMQIGILKQQKENLEFQPYTPINQSQKSIFESRIILDTSLQKKVLQLLPDFDSTLYLIYRGSRDGFDAESFHLTCDNQGETLIVIISKETKRIFGGYTDISWTSPSLCQWKQGAGKSFLYTIKEENQIVKLPCMNKLKETYHDQDKMVRFGGGNDLAIYDDCNNKSESYSNLGYSYQLPQGMFYDTDQAKSFLCGIYNFTVQDIEVYKVV